MNAPTPRWLDVIARWLTIGSLAGCAVAILYGLSIGIFSILAALFLAGGVYLVAREARP